MKLRVICQDCGMIEIIDTTKLTDWYWYKANDVVGGLKKEADWEFWVCPACQPKGEFDDEYFERILKVVDGDKEVK